MEMNFLEESLKFVEESAVELSNFSINSLILIEISLKSLLEKDKFEEGRGNID